MIFWMTKSRIRRIASKDGKGAYGRFFINRQRSLSETSSTKNDFVPSDWMKSLVSDYTNTVEKLLTKSNNVTELYTQIKQCYANSVQAAKELENAVSARQSAAADIEAEIVQIDTDIAKISKLLNDFHDGKPLPSGLTYKKLIGSKTDFEQARLAKQAQKESASDLSSVQAKHDLFMRELRENIMQLESNFSIQIDLLYKRIRRVEIKYNEQISYYWQTLCRYIQKNKLLAKNGQTIQIAEPVKQLADIASICGLSVLTQTDLFNTERVFINTEVNQSLGIQYEV